MRNNILILAVLSCFTKLAFAQGDKIFVPVAGNYYAIDPKKPDLGYKVYVRLAKKGEVSIAMDVKDQAKGNIQIGIGNKIIKADLSKNISSPLGKWKISDTGYVAIEVRNLNSGKIPVIEKLILSGSAVNDQASYVKNNEGNFFYWGRRGPSVHLNYEVTKNIDAEWFYNEVTVPEGEDVVGSYYMANGFGEGYFGIQVNSPTERRVLFSVWSPFTTDDPKSIPESHQIKMLRKGTDVHTGEFGNEGSGGQSYLKYNWKAGNTYKFLLHAKPGSPEFTPKDAYGTIDVVYKQDSTTTYTAYFFAPELNQWKLIASFKRPKTQTYIKRPHSFLENFIPEMGDKKRRVLFG
ncbi:MAG: DUF5077 domain-containing protein, partial [Chitinophagaceae bacterium]